MIIVACDENGKEKFRTTLLSIEVTGTMFRVTNDAGVSGDSADTIDEAIVSLLQNIEE